MGPERAAHIAQFLKVPGSMLFQIPLEKRGPVLKNTHKSARGLSANLFNRISNPAVNDWPLVVTATEIEKVRLVCL